MTRCAQVQRKTKETNIQIKLDLDGTGKGMIRTGIGFFDHMLSGMSRHGFLDLDVSVQGDLEVDDHHSVEDCGIVLGQAIAKAAGDKAGIKRFGNCILPMDETLVLCAVDFSGRPYLNFDVDFPTEMVGEMHTEMIREFFYAISYTAAMNIHFKLLEGRNSHHICEAVFKAFGRALDQAVTLDPRISDVLSTKGSLS